MTLRDEVIGLLRQSKIGLTVATLTERSKLTTHQGRVGNVLRALEVNGVVCMGDAGRWSLTGAERKRVICSERERIEIDEAVQFLEKMADAFKSTSNDLLRVRDLLKRTSV